jgi:UDP-GlcNAc:undecaprenyl-phosphate GlcNAc-1-phosphate transferase
MQSDLTTLSTLLGSCMFAGLFLTFIILLRAPWIGEKLGIIDHPDQLRKKHVAPTPLVGGLAIVVPFVLWAAVLLLWDKGVANRSLLLAIMLCGSGATLIGYSDDQSSTSPSSRFLSLVLLAVMATIIDPHLLPDRLNWGSFAPTIIPPWIGMSFIAVAITGFVNAVNMADGQNGIVLGMYTIWAMCLMLVGNGTGLNIAEFLFETGVIVLLFNLSGKVFLGDSGTYGITFIFGLLAIVAHNRWGVTAETVAVWFFIPIVDCLRLMVSRMLRGRAPSQGDRDHFHHRLEDKLGKTAGLVVYLGVVGSTSLLSSFFPPMAPVCMVLLAGYYFSFAWLTETRAAEMPDENLEEPYSANVVRLAKDGTSGRE